MPGLNPSPAPDRPVDTQLVQEWALELGIDAAGVCAAEPYERAERVIEDRLERGLFADLKFTMTRTERSCHPERLVPDALSVVSAALCYWAPEPAADDAAGTDGDVLRGTLARYTRSDAYAALVERLDVIASRLAVRGYESRVLVDSNDHVDREAAARSGVGFAGKHTGVITRRHGSWVVLGTLVTSAPLAPTPPMRPGCGSCTACIDACPTDALIDVAGGELDTRRCITYWTQSRHSIPVDVRAAMGAMVYGCDICQDACPWNRGVEGRRADHDAVPGHVDLVAWLDAPEGRIDPAWDRLFVPRRSATFLRRNALVALGNSGDPRNAALAAPLLHHPDALIREHAEWALRQLGGPIAEAALARIPPAC